MDAHQKEGPGTPQEDLGGQFFVIPRLDPSVRGQSRIVSISKGLCLQAEHYLCFEYLKTLSRHQRFHSPPLYRWPCLITLAHLYMSFEFGNGEAETQ